MLTFKGLSTVMFGGLVDKHSDVFSFLKDSLPKADIRIPFRTYTSTVLFTTFLIFLSCLFITVLALQIIVEISLIQMIVYSIFVPIVVSIICFSMLAFYPLRKIGLRKRSIEANLPFVLAHMGAIAESGIPPQHIFRLVSKFEEYGEISKELKKVVKSVDNLGIDALTAVRHIAKRSPSEDFKQALLGFVTTTESGGNIKTYLKNAGREALFEWKTTRERFLNQLSTYAEIYTGLLIAAPLFIVALLSIMGMVEPTILGFDILFLTKISLLLIVILDTGFLLFLRGIEVKI
jgi:flagellar protein FlaJ